MAKTKRNIPYGHYWGMSKKEAKIWAEKFKDTVFYSYYDRRYKMHGSDTTNDCPRTREFFNRAHRVRRRLERDQLRPHIVSEDFDDSRFLQKYKGVWWEIY